MSSHILGVSVVCCLYVIKKHLVSLGCTSKFSGSTEKHFEFFVNSISWINEAVISVGIVPRLITVKGLLCLLGTTKGKSVSIVCILQIPTCTIRGISWIIILFSGVLSF